MTQHPDTPLWNTQTHTGPVAGPVAMSSSAQDIMAGCPSGSVPTKEANPETTLGSAYSPVDYMSITSFPRLPEDDLMSVDNAAKLRSKDDDNVLSEQDTGELLRLTGVTGTSCSAASCSPGST